MKRLCLLTCENAKHGVLDDAIFIKELEKNHFQVENIPWRSFFDQKRNYDLVIFRTTWDYYFHLDEFKIFLEKLDSDFKMINSKDLILWNIDKQYLVELAGKGIPVVQTKVIKKLEDVQNLNLDGYPEWVIKPSISASAYETYLIHHSELLSKKLEIKKILERCTVLIQPMIESVKTKGEVSLIYFQQNQAPVYSHGLLKVPKQNDFRVQSEHGGEVLPFTPHDKILKVAEFSLKALPFDWTYARVDLVDYDTDPKIMEIELIEPELFFRMDPKAAANYIKTLQNREFSLR